MKTRFLTASVLSLLALPAHAQDQQTPGDVGTGQALYERYCATCHGLDGRGGGPMSQALVVQPSNLTDLSQRYGQFPITRIVVRIDGRDPLVSHGSDMPIWGEFFEGDDAMLKAETGQPIATSRPIVDLTAYLATLQD